MNHLYLPKIINFKVSSFFSSLFKTDEELNLSLNNSLNILIGKNSIGKTTTIELILFSIIGNYKFDVDFSNSKNSFFIDISNKKFLTRIKKLQNEIKTQLIFKIADKQIELHRNINTGRITKFLLDKKEINGAVRISFDRLTEEEDVIKAAEIIAKEVATIRRFM